MAQVPFLLALSRVTNASATFFGESRLTIQILLGHTPGKWYWFKPGRFPNFFDSQQFGMGFEVP
jgi:hypothetical protein